MKYEKNRKIFGLDEYLVIKTLRRFALPLAALVLVIIILVVDLPKRLGKGTETAPAASAETAEAETLPEETTRARINYAKASLTLSENDELNALVDRFLDARVNGDAEAMYRVFGKEADEGLETLRAQMAEEKRLYDSFSGTENWIIPGIEEDSWIVYIRTNGWFKKITASAPILMRAYVARNENGQYYMKEDGTLTSEERDAIAAADASDTVRTMNNEQRRELALAIVQDGKLGSLYERLRAGAGSEEPTEAAAETVVEDETVAEAVVEVQIESTADAGNEGPTEGSASSSEGSDEATLTTVEAQSSGDAAVMPGAEQGEKTGEDTGGTP